MIAFLAASIFAMATPISANKSGIESTESIRVMPVSKTPESNTVDLVIAVPMEGAVQPRNPVWIQFRVDGYVLGSGSQFDRASEVPVSNKGQTVHVIVDNNPYIAVNEPAIDPFNEEGFYYDTSYKFELPYSLKPGVHTIRMFPARSYGESLKGEHTFFAVNFYLGSKTNQAGLDLSSPYLTYNEPSGQIPLNDKQPVLLDFYLCNCELTQDGYKVRLTVDGKIQRMLTSWQPYYIYGLKQGAHKIRLELLDAKGNRVAGPFNDYTQTIQIQSGD